jgi:FKBP-type peptidyl-prolyl cis-trans isomerase FkpA
MNRLLGVVILLSLAAAGCQKGTAPSPSPSSGPQSEDEKVAYALGVVLGKRLAPFSLSPALVDQVKKGAGDAALGNKLAVDLEAYGPKIQEFVTSRQEAHNSAFLDKAAKEPGAVRTPSGLVAKTLRVGTGEVPKNGDVVAVSYTGSLTDGTVFDASARHGGAPLTFKIGAKEMIPCFSEGVARMKVAEQARIVCPPALAYGPQGNQAIPGNSVLIFEVELLAVNPPPPPGAKK